MLSGPQALKTNWTLLCHSDLDTMKATKLFFVVVCGVSMTIWLFLFLGLAGQDVLPMVDEVEKVSSSIFSLQRQVQQEKEEVRRLKDVLSQLTAEKLPEKDLVQQKTDRRPWSEPIPVVVFVCNRPAAVSGLVRRLLSLRPSEYLFPIIVSQDCDNIPVQRSVAEFREQISYIKHKSAQQDNVVVPKQHKKFAAYYYIARHYKLALTQIFDVQNYSTVILLEDDLDVADDFFEYFSATRYLLDKDSMLWCVSAWNDNGKSHVIDTRANTLLYRSDFFPGLGWMMTRKIWNELSPKWPAGFWDDWMREPENRKGRHCIRPEISRTKMTALGKKGASKGQFFDKHVAKVILNKAPVTFTLMNLDYLLNPTYDLEFDRMVNNSPLVDISEVNATLAKKEYKSLRIEYTGNIDFIIKADRLHVMHDFKAGVPRTAYKGVVTCFTNGVRLFLVPDRRYVKDYDKQWVVPKKFGD
ncbi:unnamed protein product [Cylicocyclus nassatus]|uniref:Alpha-1,3-mannosyl-glycoprotein 2-beta-N-acetylglucosaminyltransferase n=1 Tax=Cylicocyclus nassatus TaxID=53992 RepID=A0AA36DSK0_CYLNA|nr:unnamed protein product [Cylicocyclus nassatus]